MGVTYCEQDRQTGLSGDDWMVTQTTFLPSELPDIELKRDNTPPTHISHNIAKLSLQPYISWKLATLVREVLEAIAPILALGRTHRKLYFQEIVTSS